MPQAPEIDPDSDASNYPEEGRARDRWIIARRPARQPGSPFQPHGFFAELERSEAGDIVSVWTLLLTNRECPWHCLMCDLWKTTLEDTVPVGAIPQQIDYAFARISPPIHSHEDTHPRPAQVKLYNGGSFFDPRAIPLADYPAIAERVAGFERVIVECHPAFVSESSVRFRDQLGRAKDSGPERARPSLQLEVALGLETVEPEVLDKLNKHMTLDHFERAARFLRRNEIALRAFVLVKPPFLGEAEALYWAERSIDFAFDVGAAAVSLIPTRAGNGALEALQRRGQFAPPKLATLESALAYGIERQRGRVFADLWDLDQFSTCGHCFAERLRRLERMNLEQAILPRAPCDLCGGSA